MSVPRKVTVTHSNSRLLVGTRGVLGTREVNPRRRVWKQKIGQKKRIFTAFRMGVFLDKRIGFLWTTFRRREERCCHFGVTGRIFMAGFVYKHRLYFGEQPFYYFSALGRACRLQETRQQRRFKVDSFFLRLVNSFYDISVYKIMLRET